MTLPKEAPVAKPGGRLSPSLTVAVRRTPPTPSEVYETFWRFACERQQVFNRRVAGQPAPWTSDPILQRYRFTNAYRASDRVSQYLIRRVIYRPDLPSAPREVVFRVVLFKLFNRIGTWELLEEEFGGLTTTRFRFAEFSEKLASVREKGQSLYSAAYIMPSTLCIGERVKYRGHLRLIETMMCDGIGEKISQAGSFEEIFKLLLSYPTLGKFLAFQLAVDINYSEVVDFSEMDFVVAGPGARDGLRKCFRDFGAYCEADIIRWVADRQESDPGKLGLRFPTLYGRRLQLVDVQNLFCETSKYARVAHPLVRGTNGRIRIKQVYRPGPCVARPYYPPKWNINTRI